MRIDAILAEYTAEIAGVDDLGVPKYEVVEFQSRKNKYAICVFVINEGEKIRGQLARMLPYSRVVDIVIADGGSTDGSLDAEYLVANGVTALLTKKDIGKLSSQMRMAFHYCLNAGYSGVITIDGNGKDGLESIPAFIALLDSGVDHIQGSRFIPGGTHSNTPLSRLIGLKLLHAPLISLASGVKQTDTTNGFRGYSERLLKDPEVAIFREIFETYELHYHLAIEAGRLKFHLAETPVSRNYPRHGKTPTKISPIRGNVQVLSILLSAVFGKYRVKKKATAE